MCRMFAPIPRDQDFTAWIAKFPLLVRFQLLEFFQFLGILVTRRLRLLHCVDLLPQLSFLVTHSFVGPLEKRAVFAIATRWTCIELSWLLVSVISSKQQSWTCTGHTIVTWPDYQLWAIRHSTMETVRTVCIWWNINTDVYSTGQPGLAHSRRSRNQATRHFWNHVPDHMFSQNWSALWPIRRARSIQKQAVSIDNVRCRLL